MRVGEWKKELKRIGQPRYTSEQIADYIAIAENASCAFGPDAGIGLSDALLKPQAGERGKALKELAVLRLNLASALLLSQTPIKLPELTQASSVGAATAEIEGIVCTANQTDAAYKRAHDMAESINKGKGVGYGMDGSASIARATYKGADVTTKLKPIKDIVDVYINEPLNLQRWNTGLLSPDANVLLPYVRIDSYRFDRGATLEVMQVRPDGAMISLGTAVPTVRDRDYRETFTFHLWNISSISQLASTELRLYVRDPDSDGDSEHVKVDAVEIRFSY